MYFDLLKWRMIQVKLSVVQTYSPKHSHYILTSIYIQYQFQYQHGGHFDYLSDRVIRSGQSYAWSNFSFFFFFFLNVFNFNMKDDAAVFSQVCRTDMYNIIVRLVHATKTKTSLIQNLENKKRTEYESQCCSFYSPRHSLCFLCV